jgi:hypothetical protein
LRDQDELIVDAKEIEKLTEMHAVLDDLFVLTTIIQGDHDTISKLYPCLQTVKINLNENLAKTTNLKYFSTELKRSLSSRFNYVFSDEIFEFSMILDPNFVFSFIEKAKKELAKQKFIEYIERDYNVSLNQFKKKGSTTSRWTRPIGRDSLGDQSTIATELKTYEELARTYVRDNTSEHTRRDGSTLVFYVNVFEFWKKYQVELPHLSKLAKSLLGIPASSAAVERFFSKTGFIMRPHRRCMSDRLAEQLFFVKGNKHISSD